MSKKSNGLFAVNIYPKEIMSEMSGLTMEERGVYITLLCLQHAHGELTHKIISIACGSTYATTYVDVINLFMQNENGAYENIMMRDAMEARANYVNSRKKNGASKNSTNTSYQASIGAEKKEIISTEQINNDMHVSAHMHEYMGSIIEHEHVYINIKDKEGVQGEIESINGAVRGTHGKFVSDKSTDINDLVDIRSESMKLNVEQICLSEKIEAQDVYLIWERLRDIIKLEGLPISKKDALIKLRYKCADHADRQRSTNGAKIKNIGNGSAKPAIVYGEV